MALYPVELQIALLLSYAANIWLTFATADRKTLCNQNASDGCWPRYLHRDMVATLLFVLKGTLIIYIHYKAHFLETSSAFCNFFFHKMILSLLYTIIRRQGRDRTYDVSDVADTTCMSAAFASRLPTENACTWTRTKNCFRLRGGCHTFRRHKHK